MNFSISYDSSVVDGSMSIADYLCDWATRYCDITSNGENGVYHGGSGYWGVSHDASNTIDYSIANSMNGSTAFAVDSQLVYDPENEIAYGYLNDIKFGECIGFDAAAGYTFGSLETTFCGLADLITDNSSVIMGLMEGDVSALLEQLEAAGIDTSAALDCYAYVPEPEPYVDVIGQPETPDVLLAA